MQKEITQTNRQTNRQRQKKDRQTDRTIMMTVIQIEWTIQKTEHELRQTDNRTKTDFDILANRVVIYFLEANLNSFRFGVL